MVKAIHVSGSRKTAVARATLTPGAGIVRVNSQLLQTYEPSMSRLKIQEPLIIAGDKSKTVNIDVNVHGGGISSQAEAARLVVARALAKYDNNLHKAFLDYDRALLVADVRYKETHKPNCHGKARAKRQKSYR
jgi:small subunit ribosomal protein S9